jgi:hypothetical protein
METPSDWLPHRRQSVCGGRATHVVWHSLQISQEKMVGSLLYCRPFTVFVRPTIVDTCHRQQPMGLVSQMAGHARACVYTEVIP